MYGVIREYDLKPGTIEAVVARVRAEFAPTLGKAPGFVSYSLTQVGPDRIVTTSAFERRSQAEESTETAAAWVAASLPGTVVGRVRSTLGEIVVRHVDERTALGYGIMRRLEAKPEQSPKIIARVRDELVPMLAAMPGFSRYLLLVDDSGDHGASLSAFVDRATAEAANARVLAWLRENFATSLVRPPEIIAGEIRVALVRTPIGAP